MSYRSRERRRKARYERQIAMSAARGKRNEETARRWFVCRAKRDDRCAARGCRIRRRDTIVYRHDGKVTLCLTCAQADELVWPLVRASASWEWDRAAELQARRKPGPAWKREKVGVPVDRDDEEDNDEHEVTVTTGNPPQIDTPPSGSLRPGR